MKFTALAALGCVSATHKTDIFNPVNFLTYQHGQSFIRQMVSRVSNSKVSINDLKLGEVTFSQCDDDQGVFTLDTDSTTSTPDPITKGQKVSLDLHGIVSDSIEVKNVHIHCDWNGSTLYDEDHAQDNTYDADLAYALEWDVPSFAPGGDYDVHIKAYGDDTSKVLYCVEATFSL